MPRIKREDDVEWEPTSMADAVMSVHGVAQPETVEVLEGDEARRAWQAAVNTLYKDPDERAYAPTMPADL